MKNVLALVPCVLLLSRCDDGIIEPRPLNELLQGTYAGVTMYWIPSDATSQEGMYCACPNDRTGIHLAPSGDFLLRIEARVEHRDIMYCLTLSGYYEILRGQYSPDGAGSMPHWQGELEFTPSEGLPFQTHFSIQNAVSSPLSVNFLLPLADSSSFYITGWWRRKFENAGC